MSEKITSEKALSDLDIIKKTIDRSTQGDTIADMFISMGTLLILGGVVILFLCGVSFYLLQPAGMTPEVKKQLIIIWTISLFLLGVLKILTFKKKSKDMDLSLWGYMSHTLKGTFIGLDLPLEFSACIIMIFMIKMGLIAYIPAITAIWAGEVFAVMGSVFVNKHFLRAGWVYIILGSIGLLFMGNHILLFMAITFGIVMTALGITIRVSTKKSGERENNEE